MRWREKGRRAKVALVKFVQSGSEGLQLVKPRTFERMLGWIRRLAAVFFDKGNR